MDEDDIYASLAAVDIDENNGTGRPSNVSVVDCERTFERGNIDIPGVSQGVGRTQIMPGTSAPIDFSTCSLRTVLSENTLRETNHYARQA